MRYLSLVLGLLQQNLISGLESMTTFKRQQLLNCTAPVTVTDPFNKREKNKWSCLEPSIQEFQKALKPSTG